MIGKLTTDQLNEIVFKQLKYRRPEVLVRPGVGEDCAVVKVGDQAVVLSTDPITGTANQVGKLAININLNDIASNGVAPLGIMLTILAPVGTTLETLAQVMADASREAAANQVEIIGGHTEITDAVNRIVVSAVALGIQPLDKVISLKGVEPGDVMLLTKAVGLEGTAIIASECAVLIEDHLGEAVVEEARALLAHTSVVREGVIAGAFPIRAMHDVTEGGLLGAVYEMCTGSGRGCILHEAQVPINAITHQICDLFDVDPLRLISSGAMLMIVPREHVDALGSALTEAGIPVQEIGVITEAECLIEVEGELFEIPPPEGDALYEVLSANGTL